MEGKWEGFGPARDSATQFLGLLEHEKRIKVRVEETTTRRHLHFAFEAWAKAKSFKIGYVAAHGEHGQVLANPGPLRKGASLDAISEWIGPNRAGGRVLLLGSCRTLLAKREAEQLAANTGLLGVLGYRGSVDTIRAAVFETLILDALASAYQLKREPTGRQLKARVTTVMQRHPWLVKDLRFEPAWNPASQ